MDSVPDRRFYLALYIVGHWYHTRILYDDRDVLAIWMYRRFFSLGFQITAGVQDLMLA